MRAWSGLLVLVSVLGLSLSVRADVLNMPGGLTSLEFAAVGNTGNPGELSGGTLMGTPTPDRICGAVDHVYRIGRFEVTAGQYVEFLNAVAAADTYGLFNPNMSGNLGCGIQRDGAAGAYTYSVPVEHANRPVTFVSWGDSARFANWLTNGQPVGAQGPATTEDGAYTLNGANDDAALSAVTRNSRDTGFFIPSEDEWYKAAYHANDGATGNYFIYPTTTDLVPSNDLTEPDAGNNANFKDFGYTIGSPDYRTEVGAFENSQSPYGTFDQGGNVWEWVEELWYGSYRGLRGGCFGQNVNTLGAGHRIAIQPTYQDFDAGIRLVRLYIPGDVDGDDDVDLTDLAILASNWSTPAGPDGGDVDGNGLVDLTDLAILASNWGQTAMVVVPEPTTGMVLLALAALGVRPRRARYRTRR